MNTNDLKIFEAVAATGSFTKAAIATYTVQSNVSARIKSLEEEFDTILFDRKSRKIELTPEGLILLQYCKKLGSMLIEIKNNIQSGSRIIGELKIGCIETTIALKAPEMLNRFGEEYPDVELEFISGMRSSLIKDVQEYKLDAAFVSAPVNIADLQQIKVAEEQLVIISAKDGPALDDLLAKQQVKIVVFGEGCIFIARLESWLSSKGIINYKKTVLNSIEGIINFVEAGIGISILPDEIISEYYFRRKITSHPLDKQLGTMNTVLISRKDDQQSKALKAFVEMFARENDSTI